MRDRSVKGLGTQLFIALLIFSCTGTEISQTQIDESYKGQPLTNILVIAVTGNEHNRRTYEKKFVARLKAVGVAAVASDSSLPMPPDLKLEKEPILDAVARHGNDSVIITQLISKEKEDVYTRGGPRHRFFFSYSLDPGYSSTNTTVRLETNLYDAETGSLIWSGQSKTMSKDTTDRVMNDEIKAVINNWQKNGLIAAQEK